MFGWLFNLLYGSISMEWESAYGLEESVARLRAATKRSVLSALSETAAVGAVTECRVRLQRVIPMVGNSFKPFFIGQFVRRNERVFLVGRFTMFGAVKVFMSVWFVLVIVFGVAALFAQTATQSNRFVFVLAPFAMAGFGIALLSFGKWLARNDAAWLADVIERSIVSPAGKPESTPAVAPAGSDASVSGRPTVVWLAASILGLMGAMNLGASVLGISSAARVSLRLPSTHWSGAFRYAAAAEGLLLLAIAAGVFMRSRVAWRAGFLMIMSGWAYSVASLFLMDAAMAPPSAMRIIFVAFGLLVAAWWGRWWYLQRVHFVLPETGRSMN